MTWDWSTAGDKKRKANKDEHGHPRMAEINSAAIIKREVRDTLQSVGLNVTLVDKEVGYELRCADPVPFDMEYCRDLGYAATKYLLDGGTDAMIRPDSF